MRVVRFPGVPSGVPKPERGVFGVMWRSGVDIRAGGAGPMMGAGGTLVMMCGTAAGGVALLTFSTYGGGGFSTLMEDACASIRERLGPGEGDEGAEDEFGGEGKGERERF